MRRLRTLSHVLVFLGMAAAANPALAQAPAAPSPVQWGVRFGPSFGTLTSVETFDATAVAASFEPTLNFGAFANIGIAGPLSLQPEVLFVARGERIHHKDAQPTVTGTGTKPARADRVVLIRYLEMPVLIRASRHTRPGTSLFAIGGAALAVRRNAVVRQVNDARQSIVVDDLVCGSNVSLVYGAGLQHHRWLVDARFTRGLRNIAATPGALPLKTHAFSVLVGLII